LTLAPSAAREDSSQNDSPQVSATPTHPIEEGRMSIVELPSDQPLPDPEPNAVKKENGTSKKGDKEKGKRKLSETPRW